MKVSGDWIERPETQRVCRLLTAGRHRALFVGGCVRNALLGAPVTDIDIATDARPERVLELAEAEGLKAVATGADHGTVTVVAGGHPHEITTFRRDVETFGRHAVVAFSDDIREDAARRDFTMNALYALPDGTVVDPLGVGLTDLEARHVRFVGDAETRIREDYLRILRFFRFTAWYGDPDAGFDPAALAAIAETVEGLAELSAERVGAELKKLLAAPDPVNAVAVMARTGALSQVLPGATPLLLGPLVHAEETAGVPPDPVRRLAALGAGEAEGRALRLSKREMRQLSLLQSLMGSRSDPAELGYRHGAETARDALLLQAAARGAPLPEGALEEARTAATQRFPVTARDLMPAYEGPALGDKLAELERRWIASGFRLTREELLAEATHRP
ncbi:CCA tRNA nucleotidyltransferase [Rhodosalinus halophilus]|uniref:CCA tRNA nucleotidyltransferase n=1 Tax=Rhodosalinus halophilus TaxID=2259333 RepID=A0A365U8C6_9RHOB|nr:CCA tRNA nucleotidyltransferase [Rhodosalinus halophilus]RBI84684.1 CCA tRNA nucleotidyltransferase [Rhodosalinus halophilus]